MVRVAPFAAAAAVVLALLGLILILILERRLNRLLMGRSGSLEESLNVLTREIKEFKEFRSEVEKYLKLSEMRLRGSVQGVGLVRFNPFSGEGQGGNQSFAAAFLDEYGSGAVISTLYARDRVGVYGKPLENGRSTFELSKEEEQAIEKAKESIASHKKK
jgi:hypothetical protein